MDDLDTNVLNYAQIKAIASGNPLILEKFKIDTEVQKLQDKERNYKSTRYKLEDSVAKTIPESIRLTQDILEKLENDILKVEPIMLEENCKIVFNNKECKDYKEAGDEIFKVANGYMELGIPKTLGFYRGFEITLTRKMTGASLFENREVYIVDIKGDFPQEFEMSKIQAVNIKKIDDKLDGIEKAILDRRQHLEDLKRQLEQCKVELDKPFEFKQRLEDLLQEQSRINKELNLEKEGKDLSLISEEQEDNEDEETEDYTEYEEMEV